MNPARDLGPRLFTLLTHGKGVFTDYLSFFWIPIVGPLAASFVACIFIALLEAMSSWKRNGVDV